jgi:hypothetical protein
VKQNNEKKLEFEKYKEREREREREKRWRNLIEGEKVNGW